MVCVWPVFIWVNMTSCFIYLYFFSGSFPRFPFLWTCPRSSHLCCDFHTQCHCTYQLCPVLGKATGGDLIRTLTHACVHGSELFKAGVYTLSRLCVCTLSLILCISGCRGAPTGPHCNALPGPAAGCPQNGDDPHCHHVGHFFSRLACDGKEGFWWLENTATEDLYSPCPFSHHTKKCCETASLPKSKVPSPHSHPPQPIEIGKSGPSEGYHFFLICANVQVADFPFFLYCNILER